MLLEIVPSSERSTAEERWQRLEQHIGNPPLKSSWVWINTWLKHFGDDILHTFAFGTKAGETHGAALITRRRIPSTLPLLRTVSLGTAGEPFDERTFIHYNQLLVTSGDLYPFAVCLMDWIAQIKWSILRLDGFITEHANALMKVGKNTGIEFEVTSWPAFSFNLQDEVRGQGRDCINRLSHDTRHKLRRSMRAFENKFGPRSIEWAQTAAQANDILEELTELHTSRWIGKWETGALYTNRLKRYHKDLVDTLFPRKAIIFRVKYGDTTIGCHLNLIEETGHIANHRSGFRYFTNDNKLKSGYVTNILFMEEAKKRGYTKFDLLSGHEYYKRLITNSESSLYWCLGRRGLGALAYTNACAIYRNPRLRKVINRARGAVLLRSKKGRVTP
jgi:Acetyltransferase (GNAT) domain